MNVITVCPAPSTAAVRIPPTMAATIPMRIVTMIPMCWRPGMTRRATAPTTRPMRIHQMMTESVMTMTSPKASYGWVALWARPPDRAVVFLRALVARASCVVDVLDDLRLAGGAHLGGQVAGAGAGIDVAGRLLAAQRTRGGQAGLDPGVGRVPVHVGRVGDLLDPGPAPPAGLPREHAAPDPAVAAARDGDPDDADDDEHPAGGVQVED